MSDELKAWCGFSLISFMAVFWWKRAADQALSDSQFALGICYKEGYGVEQNRQKAKE